MMGRCPSIYTTQEAEQQRDPAHITLVCKYHQRYFDVVKKLTSFLPIFCVFRSLLKSARQMNIKWIED